MLGAPNIPRDREHEYLTRMIKSLTAGEEFSCAELSAQLSELLEGVLTEQRKLPIAYFTLLTALMERLMMQLRRSAVIESWQLRGLQLVLLKRILSLPLCQDNILPLLASLREIRLLSIQARECLIDGVLEKISGAPDALFPDIPIIFHHLLHLGDQKRVLPALQSWLSRGIRKD